MLEINKLYNCDCVEGMKNIPNNFCDIAVTSPPYKEKDGFSYNLLYSVSGELYRILKYNSLCFINFGHLKNEKARPFRVCDIFLNNGFKLADTIIWKKNHFSPLRGNNLNNLYEFIFMFYKGTQFNLDRLSIGVPYKDKSNAKRFNNGLNLRCRGNIWEIDIPTITKKSQRLHKDEFPIELPLNCIKLSSLKSGVLLEPFAGSGTSCVAAKQLGLNYLGFEKDKVEFDKAYKRLNNAI